MWLLLGDAQCRRVCVLQIKALSDTTGYGFYDSFEQASLIK